MRLWPRSIRWQMLAGLVLLELLSLGFFAALLTRQQIARSHRLIRERLTFEATSLAVQAGEAVVADRRDWVASAVRLLGNSPTVTVAKVSDASGKVLYLS